MTDGVSPDTNESARPQGLDNSPQNNTSKMSRRTLLRRGAVLSGLLLAAGSIPTNFYGIFDTKREETSREQEIEDRFGIEILSGNEAHDILGRPVMSKPSEDVIFNKDQLGMIEEFLPLLPSRFYDPRNGNKLNLAAAKEGFVKGMRRGSFTTAKGSLGLDSKPLLMLISDFFQPERKGFAFRVFTHELTHRVVDELTDNHALWKEVNEILGYENFSDFRDSLLPILDEKPPDSEVAESVRNWLGYALKGADGKGKDVPDELLGVLGGAYVGGRADFDPISTWLGKETTDRLYSFMRNRVFDGREYNGDQRPAFLDGSSYKD